MYIQPLAPLFGSALASGLLAAFPLVAMFVLLGVFRLRAAYAAGIALLLAVLSAIFVWGMPTVMAGSAAAEGVFYGLFPILWILVNALWVYRLSVATRWFEVLGTAVRSVSSDHRILAILIAFCFGALLESLAGFGAPVAISAAMLIAAGVKPLTAAVASLLANTAPVAFGALGAPIVALSGVTGIPVHDLAAMVGRQTPFLAVLIPLVLVFVVDGLRGVRATWPVAVVAGIVFAATQFVMSNFFAFELTDVVAAITTTIAVLVTLRFWKPVAPPIDGDVAIVRPASRSIALAIAPYAVVIALFSLAQIPALKDWLAEVGSFSFAWPLLNIGDSEGTTIAAQTFHLDHLRATGTVLFLSGLITAAIYRMRPRAALAEYGATLKQLRWTIVTVCTVLALSFVMNLSGQTTSLGYTLASAGGFFAVLSPIIGWIGVALTGSDTASNSLFGQLQVSAAAQTGLSPLVMAAANTSAGVLGKMVSVQNLAVASAAVGLDHAESTLFRRLLGWSLGLLVLLGILIVLQTGPFSWMVPGAAP